MSTKPRRNTSLLYSDKPAKNYKSCDLRQPAIDLFGGVVITDDDVFLWVATVAPRWIYTERSYNNYVRGWCVMDKIRETKINGGFDAIVSKASLARPWHDRLALDMITATH
jgi:hypothetical protein